LGAVERIIDRKQTFARQSVVHSHANRLPATDFDGASRRTRFESPDAGRRKIAMEIGFRFSHGESVIRVIPAAHSARRNEQRIDKISSAGPD